LELFLFIFPQIEMGIRDPAYCDRLPKLWGNFFLVQSMKIMSIQNFQSTFGRDGVSYYYCFIPPQPSF